jgi:RNA-directed DNA polymerase
MSLTTPSSVQKLQTALHAKAKESPDFRFYALYDKVYRKDVLAHAYERCEANGGAAGVDEQTFEDIERYGMERWLDELTQELKRRTYQPQPVRRVYIPKPDGKQRPLGIPTIRDRVVQTAAVLVLEPIFETDLTAEQYAYRADRSALDAVQHVHKLINTGHGQIVDADLSSHFDSVPHAELLKSVARRVVDGAMLHLIKMWLEAPVEETDELDLATHSVASSGERSFASTESFPQGKVSSFNRLAYLLRWFSPRTPALLHSTGPLSHNALTSGQNV